MQKLITLILFFVTFFTIAQTADEPIKIETSVKKISNTEFDVIFSAKIYKGWYLYSQYNPDEASLPLVISLQENESGYKLVGKAEEKDTFKKYSEVWEKDEIVFKNKAIITQRIQLINKDITQIKLNFFGQVCETACINIDEDFTISLTGSLVKENNSIDEKSKKLSEKLILNLKNRDLLKNNSDNENSTKNGFLNIFLLGFVGGFLALLTPCVFPMIPLTVSFFTKQSKKKSKGIFNAVLYGFFIVLTYILSLIHI